MNPTPLSLYDELKYNQIDCRTREIHHKKLALIKQHQSNPQANYFNIKQYHQQANRRRRSQQLENIDLENEVLLKRIISISRRKSQSQSSLKLPFIRQRERAARMDSIELQNNHLARKLVECKPYSLSNSSQKDLNEYLQRKQRLQKFKIGSDGIVRHKQTIMKSQIAIISLANVYQKPQSLKVSEYLKVFFNLYDLKQFTSCCQFSIDQIEKLSIMRQNQYFVGSALENKVKATTDRKVKKTAVPVKKQNPKKVVSPESAYFTQLRRTIQQQKKISKTKLSSHSDNKKSNSLRSTMLAIQHTQTFKAKPSVKDFLKSPDRLKEKTQNHVAVTKTLYKEQNLVSSKYRIVSPEYYKKQEKSFKAKRPPKIQPKEGVPKQKAKNPHKVALQIFQNRVIKNIKESHTQRNVLSGSLEGQVSSELFSSKKSEVYDCEIQTIDKNRKLSFHHMQSIQIYPVKQQRAKNAVQLMQIQYQNEKLQDGDDHWEEVQRKFWMLHKDSQFNKNEGISTNLYSVMQLFEKIKVFSFQKSQIFFKKFKNQSYQTCLKRMHQLQSNSTTIIQSKLTVIPQYVFAEIQQKEKVRIVTYRYQYFHDKCVFDCMNEQLIKILSSVQPYPWQFAPKRNKISVEWVFSQIQFEIIQIASILGGFYTIRKQTCSDLDHTQRLQNWNLNINDWLLEIVIQITDMIFEDLIDDLLMSFDISL